MVLVFSCDFQASQFGMKYCSYLYDVLKNGVIIRRYVGTPDEAIIVELNHGGIIRVIHSYNDVPFARQ